MEVLIGQEELKDAKPGETVKVRGECSGSLSNGKGGVAMARRYYPMFSVTLPIHKIPISEIPGFSRSFRPGTPGRPKKRSDTTK